MEAIRYWVFQARPEMFDLTKVIQPESPGRWEVYQHANEIKMDDFVYFYQSGKNAGLYGWGITSSDPYEATASDFLEQTKQSEVKNVEAPKPSLMIDVIYKVRFEKYIPKERIEKHVDWQEHQRFTDVTGTNFKISSKQANIVNELIREFGYQSPADFERRVRPSSLEEVYEHLSNASIRVLEQAEGIRTVTNQSEIRIEHLVIALFDEGTVAACFEKAGFDRQKLYAELELDPSSLPTDYAKAELDHMPEVCSEVRSVLEEAYSIAIAHEPKMIKPFHILTGLLSNETLDVVRMLKSTQPPIQVPDVSSLTFELQNKAISDVWAVDDLLGYEKLAIAIADPILAGITKAPLTVAIQAPWGHGKTTLMRMIRHQLDPVAEMEELKAEINNIIRYLRPFYKEVLIDQEGEFQKFVGELDNLGSSEEDLKILREASKLLRSIPEYKLSDSNNTSLALLKEYVKGFKEKNALWNKRGPNGSGIGVRSEKRAVYEEFFEWFGEHKVEDGGLLGITDEKRKSMPTVWFNPLYYQEKDQVWAGLAHAIFQQLTNRLGSRLKIEKFWMRLTLNRVDESAVRRDFHRMLFEEFIPSACSYVAIATISIIILLLRAPGENSWLYGLFGPISAGLVHFLGKRKWVLKKWTLEGKFEKYIKEPDYESRLGYLQLVDHDIDRALKILTGGSPIAVFIDDLDRCPPDVLTDIILAINQFISVRDRNVFFFMAMDGQKVASILGSSEKLHGKAKKALTETGAKSLGWHFLEKFINVPFFIPRISVEDAIQYVSALMGKTTIVEEETESRPKKFQEIENVNDASAAMAKAREEGDREAQKQITREVSRILRDPEGEEMTSLAEQLVADIELNPRVMKRCLVMARLLRNLQISFGRGEKADNPRLLVIRATQLIVNWPQVVAWLHEKKIKPKEIEQWVVESNLELSEWREKVKNIDDDLQKTMSTEEFFEFMKKTTKTPPGLTEIFNSSLF